MFINKIGKDHLDIGKNNQDAGFEYGDYKLICDGCSEGEHSEVGAKIFSHLKKNNYTTGQAFQQLITLFGQDMKTIRDYLCFTCLHVKKIEEINSFSVEFCGDGYIILEDNDGNITFERLDDGEYPKYYVYNYCDKTKLSHYQEGVNFNISLYPFEKYKNVGIASDGLRYILERPELMDEFIGILKSGVAVRMKRFINKYQSVFRDDITIAF